MDIFQQGPIWSGTLYSLVTAADLISSNFVRLNAPTSYDEHTSVITSFNYNQASKIPTVANLLQYTKEVAGTPVTFKHFFGVPLIHNLSNVANMSKTTKVTASMNPAGAR